MFVRRLVLALGVLSVGSVGAIAADLPVKAPSIVAPPPFSWTGFYVGGNVGYAWGKSDYSLTYPTNGAAPPDFSTAFPVIQAAPGIAGTGSLSPKGFVGGIQAGYNFQSGGIVFGFEADFSGSSLKKTSVLNTIFPPGLGNVFSGQPLNVTTSIQNDWLATIRPRLGVAVDRALFYVTGGLAVGDVKYSQSNNWQSTIPSNVTDVGSVSKTKIGWTAGAGAAYAFGNNWSVRAEYLYTDLGSVSTTNQVFVGGPANPPANTFVHSANLRINTVRFGVDYKF